MTPLLVGTALGLLFAAGVVAIVAGLTGNVDQAVRADRSRADRQRSLRRAATTTAVLVAAGVAWVATGWPVAAVAVVAGVVLAPHTLRQTADARKDRQMLEATRAWLQQLDTTVGAGVGLESALRESARLARRDSPIAGPLRRAVERLDWMDTTAALEGLAAELDNHVGDAAAVVLSSALSHSTRGLRPALHSLVEWADDQLDHLRQVEVEARSLRMTRRAVLIIWSVLAIYLAVTSPGLMAAYATATGQLVLLVIAALAAGALWLLVTWSRLPGPERFFQPHLPGGGR